MCLGTKSVSNDTMRIVGNVAHVVNLSLIAFYAINFTRNVLLVQDVDAIKTTPRTQSWAEHFSISIDSKWLQEGFCSPNHHSNISDTHLQTAILMIVSSMAYILLSYILPSIYQRYSSYSSSIINNNSTFINPWTYSSSSANQRAKYALLGAFAHGMGHFIIYMGHINGTYPKTNTTGIEHFNGLSFVQVLKKTLPGYILFWIPLLKAYMMNTSWSYVSIHALLGMIGSFLLPINYGFSYFQSFLYASSSLDQLFGVPSSHKNMEYALWPILTMIPATCISLIELTSCSSSWMMMEYGHVIYDSFLVLSYVLFHLICAYDSWSTSATTRGNNKVENVSSLKQE